MGFTQNLVPNPSFELYENCPPYPGQIHESVGWDSPNNNTTDYFHVCAPEEGGASVPRNLLGFQMPASGNAYAGIRTWIPTINGNPVYREYLSIQLLQPLLEGHRYAVNMMVSLAETSSHTSDNLGIYLSPQPFKNLRLYSVSPQISNPNGQWIKETRKWISVRGDLIADGGEEYLIIGNFETDEAMNRQIIAPNDEPKVYFYIDDLILISCPDKDLVEIVDTTICKGGNLLLSGLPEALSYNWNNGSTTPNISVDKAGEYKVVSQTNCYEFVRIFQVMELDCNCQAGLTSPRLIENLLGTGKLPLFLNQWTNLKKVFLFDILGRQVFHWSADSVTPSLPDLAAGTYVYLIEFECINGIDSPNNIQTQTGKWIVVN